MIYHPEGVLRPTPKSADNETEFVYDYFIKDYLGNVRVVLTEEDANYSEKFLATMEEVHRQIERDNFDNIDETAQDLPSGYPVNGSVELNKKIASLSTANGTQIGPSMVLPVRRGDQVSLSTEYFYSEDAPGSTYDNVNMFVNEILLALAASGSGILRLTEGQLIDLASGGGQSTQMLNAFLSSNFDTTDVGRPHAYLVWMLYDNSMRLLPQGSGARRVTDPNALKTLLEDDIPIIENGYLHAYVSNGSVKDISFDNFLVTYMRGNTRQVNHYYPYGLTIAGIDGDYDDYLNKYTSKELQTGEFDPGVSTGLEMFDFGSRFYDPQIGRWHTPDPAEQFHNPYLAMGNNPVMYVDPDGEFIFAAVGIGFALGAISGYSAGKAQGATGQDLLGYTLLGGAIGGTAGIIGAGSGAGVAAGFAKDASLIAVGATSGAVGGFAGGSVSGMGTSLLNGASFGNSLYAGVVSGIAGAASGAVMGAISGGIAQKEINAFKAENINTVTVQKELPTLEVFSDPKYKYYVHNQDSRFRVAQAIQRTQSGINSGYNIATDFTNAQLSWIQNANGGTYNSLIGDFPGIWTLGLSGTAAAGLGINVSGGLAFDFRNGFDVYGYVGAGPSYGVDVSGGVNFGHISPTKLSVITFQRMT